LKSERTGDEVRDKGVPGFLKYRTFSMKRNLGLNFSTAYLFHEFTGVKTGGRMFLGKDSDFPVFTEGLAILEKPIAEAVELDGPKD
jgi:hypothetical protein